MNAVEDLLDAAADLIEGNQTQYTLMGALKQGLGRHPAAPLDSFTIPQRQLLIGAFNVAAAQFSDKAAFGRWMLVASHGQVATLLRVIAVDMRKERGNE